MTDYNRLVKAYDIRGIVPEELDATIAYKIGMLFVRLTAASIIGIAHDMRDSSEDLASAFATGAAVAGADVLDAGLGSTDYAYYLSGALNIPAAMITASHNPAKYNGIKLCRAGAAPVGEDTGLALIRDWLRDDDIPAPAKAVGAINRRDLLPRVRCSPSFASRSGRHSAVASRRRCRQRDGRLYCSGRLPWSTH